ncbi:MAG: hypothetical protein KQH67_05635 [Bacteroidetes bacterium]|nr:hypothetical protein [Bacteroidota bacterium]
MKQIIYLLLNTFTLIFALAMNYLSGTGAFGGKTVGEVSAMYENLFTPAGYAFAIWGLIYLLLIAFTGFQWYNWLKNRQDHELNKTAFWFALANIANGLWIYAWLNLFLGITIFLMLVLLISLIVLTFQLRLEIWDAPLRIVVFVWWPVCIYLGWIIVASVANTSAFLVSIGWQGSFLSETTWTIVMIMVATIIYVLLIYYRNMREAAIVGVWALVAIAVKQWELNTSVVYAAIIASAILFLYVAIHGFRNRKTSPLLKIKRGEV